MRFGKKYFCRLNRTKSTPPKRNRIVNPRFIKRSCLFISRSGRIPLIMVTSKLSAAITWNMVRDMQKCAIPKKCNTMKNTSAAAKQAVTTCITLYCHPPASRRKLQIRIKSGSGAKNKDKYSISEFAVKSEDKSCKNFTEPMVHKPVNNAKAPINVSLARFLQVSIGKMDTPTRHTPNINRKMLENIDQA